MAEKQKFHFNGSPYAVKGRLCHAIVKYYVEQNPKATLKDLQKVFNTEKNMIVVSYDMAMTLTDSSGKKGGDYYTKEVDLIPVKDGKAVVWSYWPERYFIPFMEQVKALGYSVTEQDEGVTIKDNAEKETKPKGGKKPDSFCETSKIDKDKLEVPPTLNAQRQTTEENPPMPLNESVKENVSGGLYDNQLEQLIESALADGVLTDKEKGILKKKAQSMGIDLDEFEMVLEARLFEMNKDDVDTTETLNYGTVRIISDKYKKQFDSIDIKREVRRHEHVERKTKTGKIVITNQIRRVKKTETDTYETQKAQKDYLLSLNPQTKEEVLAVVEFLSSFMSITDTYDAHPLFNDALQKYLNVLTLAKKLYSSDLVFMELLKTVSAPVFQAKAIVDKSIPVLGTSLKNLHKERKKDDIWQTIFGIVKAVLFVAPWFLLLLYGRKLLWLPIVVDVVIIALSLLGFKFEFTDSKMIEKSINYETERFKIMEKAALSLQTFNNQENELF